ncbi:hypothetical protein NMG60_11025091 [Bertholletia excelsa]
MIEERQPRPPYGILLAAVVVLVLVVPSMIGEQGEAITAFIEELISPVGLFLLPVILLLVIQFLSSSRGSALAGIFGGGGPDSIHRASGSPFGVALFLIILLFLLYYKTSLFGGGDEEEESDE